MTRMPRVTGKDILTALKQDSFKVVHRRGSHHYLRKGDSGKLVVVPVHGNSIVPLGTLKSILHQADMTQDRFKKLL